MQDYPKIKQRRRQVIIHSILYYKFDESIVSDHQYDFWCKELVELHDSNLDYSDEFDRLFKDFTGETGFNLVTNQTVDRFMRTILILMRRSDPSWSPKGYRVYYY